VPRGAAGSSAGDGSSDQQDRRCFEKIFLRFVSCPCLMLLLELDGARRA